MRAIGRTARLAGGPHLRYVEHGDPTGTPVVLLHGYTDSWWSFEPVLRHLPARVRAIALTQRGHGDSDRPAEGYAPRDLAGDVAGVLDYLELPAAFVVGHSMGGYVAQRLALDHPRRVRGLVLAATFVSMADNPVVGELAAAVAELEDPVDPAFARGFQEGTLALPVPAHFFDTVVRESLKVPARVWRAALRDQLGMDHTRELGAIGAPTLVVWGDQDAIVSERDQEVLAAGIRGARRLTYRGAGHALTGRSRPASRATSSSGWTRWIRLSGPGRAPARPSRSRRRGLAAPARWRSRPRCAAAPRGSARGRSRAPPGRSGWGRRRAGAR
jgi:pimeloyl-ACP methyl ester carboxylesterase